MKVVKIIKWIVILLILAALVWLVFWFRRGGEEVPVAKIEPAKVIDVRPMLRLCSVEVEEDIPIKANIGKRHIFARARLTGSILFDLDSVKSRWQSDTLIVILPPEIVQIRESTAPGSYEVIDTWNEQLLRSSNFTAAEENDIKHRAVEVWRGQLYSRGTIRRARAEAITNLGNMLAPFLQGKHLQIIDPSPEGYQSGGSQAHSNPGGATSDNPNPSRDILIPE